MAFRFCDSFDHYDTSQGFRKWTIFGGSIGPGRHNNGLTSAGSSLSAYITLDMQNTWIVGVAMNTETLGTAGFIRILGDADVNLSGVGDGRLRVRRGDPTSGTILGTSTNAVYQTNTWHYFEFRVTIDNTAGIVQVRVDGATVAGLNLSGINTGSAAGTANQINLQGAGGGFSSTFDDLYVNDGTGSINNGFFGDVEIMAILPDEDNATYHQWTPLGGSAGSLPQYTQVSDNPPDDDGSYIFSKTPGQISLFGFPTLSFTGTVQGVQISAMTNKSDVGNRSFKPVIRRAGTNYEGGEHFVSTDYIYYRSVYDTDPNGSVPWTVAAVNEANFGVREES